MKSQQFPVLMVEDNPHDILATKRAWKQHQIPNPLFLVENGEACINFLFRQGEYSDPAKAPVPAVVVLDIKLPKIDGLSLLKKIRESNAHRFLPVVMFTTSAEETDKLQSYQMGANAYIRKPMGYQAFSDAILYISRFWTMVELPGGIS